MSQWYFQGPNGDLVGPVNDHEFLNRRAAGEILDVTRVWRPGWRDWTNFSDLQQLSSRTIELQKGPSQQPPPLPAAIAAPARVVSPPDEGSPDWKLLDFREVQESAMPKRYEKCSQCGERWAEDMLWRTGRVAVCWPCMQKHERALENRRRSKLPNGPGDDIGSWIFKIALIGLIVGAIVIAFFMSQKKHSVPPPKNPLATPALRR